MSNLPQSDLILAGRFVDGDLPAHEAARAEARIAKDADFAAAVEQIRDQSSLLGRLPKFKPSDDLADRTLQASMDQVKAIMGAWPSDSDGEKVTAAPEVVSKSFDWKSTAALVASLAGVFMIGAMLWQTTQSANSDLAMSEAPPMSVASRDRGDDTMSKKSSAMDDVAEMEKDPESSLAAAGMQEQSQSIAKSDRSFRELDEAFSKAAPQKIAAPNSFPGRGTALSGTPMKRTTATPRQLQNIELANTSAPVSQIWCVSQDSTASKSSVCDILNLNEIAVQREEAPQAAQTSDAVEAFYVAATPKQMKLAMSQISNNADIEMIEIPSRDNSPIADAIQQQFTHRDAVPKVNTDASLDNNLPPNFQRAQALGQHLVSNSLPRGLPSPNLGPAPPILDSNSKIAGLQNAPDAADLAMGSRARNSAAPASNTGGGGGAGFGGGQMKDQSLDSEIVMAEEASILQQQTARPTAQAELDKYLDDSEQLQQYLILVRGGEEEKR